MSTEFKVHKNPVRLLKICAHEMYELKQGSTLYSLF